MTNDELARRLRELAREARGLIEQVRRLRQAEPLQGLTTGAHLEGVIKELESLARRAEALVKLVEAP